MRKGFIRGLAGILAAQMLFLNGSALVYAVPAENPPVLEVQDQGDLLEESNAPAEEPKEPEVIIEPEAEKPAEEIAGDVIQTETEQAPAPVKEDHAVPVKGEIEVLLISGMEVQKEQTFHVTLKGPVSDEKEVVLTYEEGKEAPHRTVRFDQLVPGSYEISISGDRYLTYTQTVAVDGLGYRIQVYTSEVEGFGEVARPGSMRYGDVTGDGKLDQEDITRMVDAIDSGQQEPVCDLNGDGQTDLADLQVLSSIYEMPQQTATVETWILKESLAVSAGEQTVLEGGSLDALLTGGGGVLLKPSGGAAISEAHPVELCFDFDAQQEPVQMAGLVIEQPSEDQNWIENGVLIIEYLDENGALQTMEQPITSSVLKNAGIKRGPDGTLIIDLGGQIAVKKVTLKVTATANQGNLAEISKVKFLNSMENHIPAPEMDIPKGVVAQAGNREITLTWEKAKNVTGYEVAVSDGKTTEYYRTSATTLHVTAFKNDKLENKQTYSLKVQSLNGEWKSGFGEAVTAMPKVDTVPEPPDQLKVEELYRGLEIRWKASKDQGADTYNLYYKEAASEKFEKIEGITGTYYKLTNLKDNTKYQIYVTGVNDLGEGNPSLTAAGTTLKVEAVPLPHYKIFTEAREDQPMLTHVTGAKRGAGKMVDSVLDEGMTAKGIVDNNFGSYYHLADWDDAVHYHKWEWGLSLELDQACTTDRITFAAPDDSYLYGRAAVYYVNEAGKEVEASGVSLLRKTVENGRSYYLIKLAEPITSSRIRIGVATSNNARNIAISEIRIYSYDSLEKDIQELYADDLHLVLKDTVTEAVIDALQVRLDTKDHDEYHPDRKILQKELDAARVLLTEQQQLKDTVAVHPEITKAKDSHLKFSGLNAWQPLGVSAAAGEELVVYVGNPKMATGRNTSLRLVFSQVHAESDGAVQVMNTPLKIGRNEITVPKWMTTDVEKGGAVYVEYTGNNDQDRYGLRISGGTKVPVLDLYKVKDAAERQKRIQNYIKELEAHTANLQASHEALHQNSTNSSLAYAYQERTCILNTTDILLDQMMLSVPASQITSALKGSANPLQKLTDSLDAMNEMMTLFYQHKGLTDTFAPGTEAAVIRQNRLPAQHLNIRYMKMFAGAFMYAAGHHIGIEWDQVPLLTAGKPITTDENGIKTGGQYFGWGIAHEIGHNINEPSYVVGEVTNNYFSVLAQADETNVGVRFEYEKVYDKVTSSTIGKSDNVFTQLGLYWQLHLAYDQDYNYTTYDDYQTIKDHLFFARVDSYSRKPDAAPSPKGIALILTGDKDQNLMRLASAAAEKDLTDFFTRWGMVPDEATTAYLSQFEAEERAIYYGNDEARVYRKTHRASQSIAGKEVVSAALKESGSQVTLDMSFKGDPEGLIGYEVVRVTREQGQIKKAVTGFTTTGRFTDNAAQLGSRAVSYEVTAIDKFMNRSAVYKTPAVKLTGDGLQVKDHWEIVTNMSSDEDRVPDAGEQDPCAPEKVSAASRIIDGDPATVYHGKSDQEDPYIVLALKKDTEVSAVRYTLGDEGAALTNYRIEVSADGQQYTTVKEGRFELQDGRSTVYLTNRDIVGNEGADPWVATYNATYVKITAIGQKGSLLSIGELDLLGPSGDNVTLLSDGIGKLKTDYIYQPESAGQPEEKIPAGSLVFTGTYKGNPAYNVVMLYDDAGQIVGGTDQEGALTAHQIILAPDPGNALLGETSEGIWIYWIEPQDLGADFKRPSQVRTELYRVDNALTNEGQRLVSDTLFVEVPKNLPDLEIRY